MTRITDYTSLGTAAAGDALVIVDIDDTTMSPAGTTKQITMAGLMAQTYTGISILDPAYDGGAFTDGVSDSTAAIQAVMNAAAPFGCPVFVPAGITFRASQLTWNSGQIIHGVDPGTYPGEDAIPTVSLLARLAGTNEHLILVPDTINYGAIRFIAIDGNKNNNSSGDGFHIADGAAGQESQIVIERCFFHDNPGSDIYLGYNRRANKVLKGIFNYAGVDGITNVGSDNLITENIIGSNARAGVCLGTTATLGWAAAATNPQATDVAHVFNNDIYGNLVGIALSSGSVNCLVIGNGIDRHLNEGVSVYSGYSNSILCNAFHSNGTQTNDTYGHIHVGAGVDAVAISDNNFGPLDSGISNVASFCVVTDSGIPAGAIVGNIGVMDPTSTVSGLISTAGGNTSPSVRLSNGGGIIQGANSSQHIFQIRDYTGTILFDMDAAGTFTVNDGNAKLQSGLAVGNAHAAQNLTANGDTLSISGSYNELTSTGAYTGLIMPSTGFNDGQVVVLNNIGTHTLTFAAAGTSNVAAGASASIPTGAGTVLWLMWSQSQSLWYANQGY
jgi:hypothetical protein